MSILLVLHGTGQLLSVAGQVSEEERALSGGPEMPPMRWSRCRSRDGPNTLPSGCCLALQANYEVHALGGCHTNNPHIGGLSERCKLAAKVCEECPEGLDISPSHEDRGGQDSSLHGFSPESLRLRCAQNRNPRECHEGMAEIGIGVILFAGVVLLILSVASAWLFHRVSLPRHLEKSKQALTAPVQLTDASFEVGKAWPKPPPFPPAEPVEPPSQPPVWAVGNSSTAPHSLDACASGPDALRMAAASETGLPAEVAGEPDSNNQAKPEMQHVEVQAPVAKPREPAVSCIGRWPERLAEVWAFRTMFLKAAAFGVLGRLGHLVLGGFLDLNRANVAIVFEACACVLPLVWVAFTSRPPCDPQAVIPASIAYGPCCRLPRFIAFSMATIVAELYSIFIAAWLVVGNCDAEPWKVVLPYCVGVVVAVTRSYSAVLALNLQEHLSHACCRVLPDPGLDHAAALAVASKGLDYEEGVEAPATFELDVTVVGSPMAASMRNASALPAHSHGHQAGVGQDHQHGGGSRVCCWRRPQRWNPDFPLTEARDCGDDSYRGDVEKEPSASCCSRCRRRLTKRMMIAIGLAIVVLSATTSVWIIRAAAAKEGPPRPPSSCVTAQNGTATCEPFDLVSKSSLRWSNSESSMDRADTVEDCCRGCDELEECQAYMFEQAGKRCLWTRFLEEPCIGAPGNLGCRCLAHFDSVFGFKPTGRVVWLHQGKQGANNNQHGKN